MDLYTPLIPFMDFIFLLWTLHSFMGFTFLRLHMSSDLFSKIPNIDLDSSFIYFEGLDYLNDNL